MAYARRTHGVRGGVAGIGSRPAHVNALPQHPRASGAPYGHARHRAGGRGGARGEERERAWAEERCGVMR